MTGAQGEGAEPPSDKPGQRRLARDGDRDKKGANDGTHADDRANERRLERLARDLDDTAAACRDRAPGCRAEAENRARDLSDLAHRAAGAEPLRRLERAARQMRSRVGRGELAEGEGEGEKSDARRFQRAARGERQAEAQGEDQGGAEGEAAAEAGKGQRAGEGQGRGDPGKPGGDARGALGSGTAPGEGEGGNEGAGEAALAKRERDANGAGAEGGDGIGTGPGGPALGRRDTAANGGHATEARVANGAGPSRAEVIGVAAGRGFAGRSYAQVFADYQAAVEDALGATAVPEGKRYIVRRYFDLIRPRSGSRRP